MFSARCPVCGRRNCRVRHRVKRLARRRRGGEGRHFRGSGWGVAPLPVVRVGEISPGLHQMPPAGVGGA